MAKLVFVQSNVSTWHGVVNAVKSEFAPLVIRNLSLRIQTGVLFVRVNVLILLNQKLIPKSALVLCAGKNLWLP